MCIRKLRGYPRTIEIAKKLDEYITAAFDKPNGVSPMKIIGRSIKAMVSREFIYLLKLFSQILRQRHSQFSKVFRMMVTLI